MKSLICTPLTLILTLWLTPWQCISEELRLESRSNSVFSSNYNVLYNILPISRTETGYRNLQKRSPLDIGGQRRGQGVGRKNRKKPSYSTTSSSNSDFSDYSATGSAGGSNSEIKNVSEQSFTGNPNEYTIGGVLSSMDVEHYFIQILSVSTFCYIFIRQILGYVTLA